MTSPDCARSRPRSWRRRSRFRRGRRSRGRGPRGRRAWRVPSFGQYLKRPCVGTRYCSPPLMRFYEFEARKIVELAGIPVTKYGFCTTAEEARPAAQEIGGPGGVESQGPSGGGGGGVG